jgi:hypothetical protein
VKENQGKVLKQMKLIFREAPRQGQMTIWSVKKGLRRVSLSVDEEMSGGFYPGKVRDAGLPIIASS